MRYRDYKPLGLVPTMARGLAAAAVCALLAGVGATTALAQAFDVAGQVTSATDGSPLPGVNIVELGTQTGTTTDIDGEYALTVSGPNVELQISFVGYETQTVPVNGRSRINIVLGEDIVIGQEVVVTAFGIERQERSL